MTDLFSSLQKTLLKSDDNKTLTENGAVAYKSIGDKLVDLDASVMSLRNATAEEVMEKFHAVYSENPENAIIWMFMVGDIREGNLNNTELDLIQFTGLRVTALTAIISKKLRFRLKSCAILYQV